MRDFVVRLWGVEFNKLPNTDPGQEERWLNTDPFVGESEWATISSLHGNYLQDLTISASSSAAPLPGEQQACPARDGGRSDITQSTEAHTSS